MWSREETDRLYKAIFRRKSVRKFESKALADPVLDEVLRRATDANRLLPSTPVAFRILTDQQVRGMVSAKAPHYLAVYTGNSDEAHVNAAFMLQQVDLWLSLQGMGSCWLGMPRPVQEAAFAEDLPFVILLAFGKAAEEQQRNHISEFKRRPIRDITSLNNMEDLLEPVRLAPSGTNRQPWYLTGTSGEIHLFVKQNNVLTKKILGVMPFMDMGIALCHLWLSALTANRFFDFREAAGVSGQAPRGYSYVWSVGLKQQQN